MRRLRNLLRIGIAGSLAVGLANGAGAATLPFTGRLALSIATLEPISIAGAGFATVEGRAGDSDHLAKLDLEASRFGATGLIVPVTDPNAAPILGVVATVHNAAGGFRESSGNFGGTLPILGVAKVCLFGSCTATPLANLSVPISVVGRGGSAYASGPVNVTVQGAPWTTGTVFVGASTAMGSARGPASGTTSTLNPSGAIRLVTPIFISTNLGGSAVIPAFAVLALHFVPEPGDRPAAGRGHRGADRGRPSLALAHLARAGEKRRGGGEPPLAAFQGSNRGNFDTPAKNSCHASGPKTHLACERRTPFGALDRSR